MKAPIVIWGGRGHPKVLREFLPELGFRLVAMFDKAVTVSPCLGASTRRLRG
jgi:hypothetical protein